MNCRVPGLLAWSLLCLAAGATAAVAGGSEHVVGQKNKSFSVSKLEAKVGDVVQFRNDDGVFHNIFSLTSGLAFDLGAYAPGTSKQVKLDQPGRIDVECAIHPRMKMVIDVSR